MKFNISSFVVFFVIGLLLLGSCNNKNDVCTAECLKKTACEITKNIPSNSTLAILDFEATDNKNRRDFDDLPFYLSDALFNCNNKNLKLIGRQYLKKAVKELKITQSELFDNNSNIKKLGKFLKADYIILGNVIIHDKIINVHISCLDVQTLTVIFSGSVSYENQEYNFFMNHWILSIFLGLIILIIGMIIGYSNS